MVFHGTRITAAKRVVIFVLSVPIALSGGAVPFSAVVEAAFTVILSVI